MTNIFVYCRYFYDLVAYCSTTAVALFNLSGQGVQLKRSRCSVRGGIPSNIYILFFTVAITFIFIIKLSFNPFCYCPVLSDYGVQFSASLLFNSCGRGVQFGATYSLATSPTDGPLPFSLQYSFTYCLIPSNVSLSFVLIAFSSVPPYSRTVVRFRVSILYSFFRLFFSTFVESKVYQI